MIFGQCPKCRVIILLPVEKAIPQYDTVTNSVSYTKGIMCKPCYKEKREIIAKVMDRRKNGFPPVPKTKNEPDPNVKKAISAERERVAAQRAARLAKLRENNPS